MCPMGVQHDALETMNDLFDEELEASIGYYKVFQQHEELAQLVQ